MRLRLQFKLSGDRQYLPLNYQYPISAWIYKVLANADAGFTRSLHDEGYVLENGKTFKLFTFSRIYFPKNSWKILNTMKSNFLREQKKIKTMPKSDRMLIWSRNASLIIAFQLPEQSETFVMGLFKDQEVFIGDKISGVEMQVETIEAVPIAIENTIGKRANVLIRATTPVVIGLKNEGQKHEEYIPPFHHEFKRLFIKNLLDKHALCSKNSIDASDVVFVPVSLKSRSGKQTIKAFRPDQTEVKGYYFDFRLQAPPELIEIGLNAGFGSMNSLGFGFGEVVVDEI
ncbi:MAG: CRISPR-associated endoribonuclease Cas6 [Chlorobi bacterium]|nr:CRISPR-associated endoribonuclease Cas6 [Chlorobiota bacterium]